MPGNLRCHYWLDDVARLQSARYSNNHDGDFTVLLRLRDYHDGMISIQHVKYYTKCFQASLAALLTQIIQPPGTINWGHSCSGYGMLTFRSYTAAKLCLWFQVRQGASQRGYYDEG